MLVWLIIIIVLLLLLILPVGVDALYTRGKTVVRAKIGFLRFQVFPGKKEESSRPHDEESAAAQPSEDKTKKPKLNREEIFSLLKIGLNALKGLRRHISLDYFKLHWTAAASDPFDSVMQYGRMNAILSAVLPLFREAFHVRKEDIGTAVDLEREKPEIEAEIIATLQVWEILSIAAAAGVAFLKWRKARKKRLNNEMNTDDEKGTE